MTKPSGRDAKPPIASRSMFSAFGCLPKSQSSSTRVPTLFLPPTVFESAATTWRQFRVEFAVPASREWKIWTGKDRKALNQLEFAELIEDNLPDIVGTARRC